MKALADETQRIEGQKKENESKKKKYGGVQKGRKQVNEINEEIL
jgi:hypothetical protein